MTRAKRSAAAVMAAMAMYCVVAVAGASPASATDGNPCGAAWNHPRHGQVQTCPDWSNRADNLIPVYSGYSGQPIVVGWINAAGDDWYRCQVGPVQDPSVLTASMHYNGHEIQNNWWALTLADDGRTWGYVPEIFFRGGNNFERDAGLRLC